MFVRAIAFAAAAATVSADWTAEAFNPDAFKAAPSAPIPLGLFAAHFQDHMVLQRGGAGPVVWGFVPAGSKVGVTFAGSDFSALADSNGVWRVTLNPLPAGGPYTLTASGPAGTQTIQDILIGDVYLVGGQSNAQFTVASAFNASEEIAAAVNYPNIRVFTVGQGTQSSTPLKNLATIEQNWTVATPESIGLGNWSAFSAIGWFFGKNVYDALGGTVPIGLISDNWGGTPIQHWMSAAALSKCTSSPDSVLYNAMIAPLQVGPLAVTGAIWYQGEQNSGASTPTLYQCAQPELVLDWRNGFNNPNFFFAIVQLAPWIGGANFDIAIERYAQESVLTVPLTGIATAIDLGDPTAPYGSVHPRRKQAVGARLAANALALVYGKNVPYLSPRFLNATGSTVGVTVTVTVSFVPETISDGLQIVPGVTCPSDVATDLCAGFVIQLDSADNGPRVPATGVINGNVLTLTAQAPGEGSVPVLVQSAYSTWPIVSLYSRAGFPALPFNATVYPAA